ncbi:hypothetical protein GCM10007269_31270 [Microbacterium murale]|uniref:Uncharacterized protein n=1 Tax=Microbacterium murale TaxID=1081040 RepID=A0ABQ1RXI5_9MICO|nr:hypothetical protein [Microbacterium murale]GGD86076.1 hypothetical protein GCM10007269_31270 [Microbacterium murale]
MEHGYALRHTPGRLIGGELDCEVQHLRTGREVVLQLSQRHPRLAGDFAHCRPCPALLVDDRPQRMGDGLASLAMIDLFGHAASLFQYT